MSDTILTCGNFSVRSRKAADRFRIASANELSVRQARYHFFNWDEPTISLTECMSPVALIIQDDENVRLSSENCPALFFDQTPYMVSIKLPEDTEKAWVFSPIAAWCDGADWDSDTKKLSVPINFGNDLGDFELCWEWETSDGNRHSASFGSQVFSTKLDIYEHFEIMLNEVKERFEWIQLDLLRQTTWGWSHDADSDGNMKTWLLIFQEVRETMEELLRKLVAQHRRRLIPETRMLRAERVRKIPAKLEERIAEGIHDNPNRRYQVTKKVLDADTPENRYMKHVLSQTLEQLNEVIDKIKPVERISDVFKERLTEWHDAWRILKQHRFWRGIGEFRGLRRESLILSQDPLYAGIRRSWYLLQHGLRFLDKDLRGGIQNAAQLYEIWCLVKLDELVTAKGWLPVDNRAVDFERPEDDFDSKNTELRSGSVKFTYEKEGLYNVDLSLLFQPKASVTPERKGIWNGMMAVPVAQTPDIVLRLHRNDLPNKPVYTWIFDAKYRLDGNNAPDDAVNQMHRYRDAILWAGETAGAGSLTRESIGAYVLYPGDESSLSKSSKQISSVNVTNIGAYPLRPDKKNSLPQILGGRLDELLNVRTDFDGVMEGDLEYFKSVPSVKQVGTGMIGIGSTRGEQKAVSYWTSCRLYRMPVTEAEKAGVNPAEWEYLAPQRSRESHFGVFPIISCEKLSRAQITELYQDSDIPISNRPGSAEDIYWFFRLADPLDAPEDLTNLKRGQVASSGRFVLDRTT